MSTWINIPPDSDFSIHNIPFGVGSFSGGRPFACTRIGDYVIDLSALATTGFFEGVVDELNVFDQSTLNDFVRLGKSVTNEVRSSIQRAFVDTDSPLRQMPYLLRPANEVVMHLPVHIGDYTDFYSSIEHATNVQTTNALVSNV